MSSLNRNEKCSVGTVETCIFVESADLKKIVEEQGDLCADIPTEELKATKTTLNNCFCFQLGTSG